MGFADACPILLKRMWVLGSPNASASGHIHSTIKGNVSCQEVNALKISTEEGECVYAKEI